MGLRENPHALAAQPATAANKEYFHLAMSPTRKPLGISYPISITHLRKINKIFGLGINICSVLTKNPRIALAWIPSFM
jgi:hypothetical protein